MAPEQQVCEFVDACPMFAYFRQNARRVYLMLYCRGDFHVCRRRSLLLIGEPAPDGLLPYGGRLREHDRSLGVPLDEDRNLAGAA